MSKRTKAAIIILFFLGILGLAAFYMHSHNVAVFNPKGTIAAAQRKLMIFTLLLSVVVVVPVFTLTFLIVWKYRASNTKVKKRYEPEYSNRFLELLWWGVPGAIILVLAIVTWNSSHALDPFKAIDTSKKPLTIQVVALNWKWLFIYPDKDIATVNYFDVPVNTPVSFHITSDAPMNSFWVPQLAGQIYAMSGMDTQLHIEATSVGNYNGSSANISGDGFAGMKFVAQAVSQSDFDKWTSSIQHSSAKKLTTAEYNRLVQPTENSPRANYAGIDNDLYNTVIYKYMSGRMAGGSGGMHH